MSISILLLLFEALQLKHWAFEIGRVISILILDFESLQPEEIIPGGNNLFQSYFSVSRRYSLYFESSI